MRTERDRILGFIGANPPNKEFKGLQPLLGTPTEIKAKLDSLPSYRGGVTTPEKRADQIYIMTAFQWIGSDFDELTLRPLRSNAQSAAFIGLFLMINCFALKKKANPALQPTPTRDYVAAGRG